MAGREAVADRKRLIAPQIAFEREVDVNSDSREQLLFACPKSIENSGNRLGLPLLRR